MSTAEERVVNAAQQHHDCTGFTESCTSCLALDLAREAIARLRRFPVPGISNSQEAWREYWHDVEQWDLNERRKFLDGEP